MNCPHCGKSIVVAVPTTIFSDADIVRFWSHVEKTDGCWLSKAQPSGIYARLYMGGKPVLAHIASYTMHFGLVPTGCKVCHSCDTPRCVRPDHLEAKPQSVNMRDMISRGRNKPKMGQSNPNAKLSDADVDVIRKRLIEKSATIKQLAKDYGVSFQNIWRIARGLGRGNIAVILPKKIHRLSDAEVIEVSKLCAERNLTQTQIAKQFGVTQGSVSYLKRGLRGHGLKRMEDAK